MSEKQPTGFQYQKTNSFICYDWKNGTWNEGELQSSESIEVSLASTALHYGQSAFEGMKAFSHADGSIHVFRPRENAKRMRRASQRLLMPEVSDDMFLEALQRVINDNKEFVPDSSDGSALYIRPFLFGSGPTIGVQASPEYKFIVMVIPVGNYYKDNPDKLTKALIWDIYDRAAPFGMGNVKAAGNYAADLLPTKQAKDCGYDLVLYLDAKTRTQIEEFGTSNFVGITQDGTYITPKSETILNSITNQSLMDLCDHLKIPNEKRAVTLEEVSGLKEVGACGTAVVITSIDQIDHGDQKIWSYEPDGESVLKKLKEEYQAIQTGRSPDPFEWLYPISKRT